MNSKWNIKELRKNLCKEESEESITPPSTETKSPTEEGAVDAETERCTWTKQITGIKQIALTFDDGPDPKVTMQILETLNKYDAKATFFMLGSRVEYYPEIAKKVQEAGHELGNHTWNHPDLTKAGVEKIRK